PPLFAPLPQPGVPSTQVTVKTYAVQTGVVTAPLALDGFFITDLSIDVTPFDVGNDTVIVTDTSPAKVNQFSIFEGISDPAVFSINSSKLSIPPTGGPGGSITSAVTLLSSDLDVDLSPFLGGGTLFLDFTNVTFVRTKDGTATFPVPPGNLQ